MPTWASGGKTEFCGACFDCRRKGEQESRFLRNEYQVRREHQKIYLATVQETANSSAWNHIFNFQRRGPPRRRARKLLSRCCTHGTAKEPISALPDYGSKGKFGARAELRNILQEKLRGRGGSSCRFDRKIGKKMFFFVGNATGV